LPQLEGGWALAAPAQTKVHTIAGKLRTTRRDQRIGFDLSTGLPAYCCFRLCEPCNTKSPPMSSVKPTVAEPTSISGTEFVDGQPIGGGSLPTWLLLPPPPGPGEPQEDGGPAPIAAVHANAPMMNAIRLDHCIGFDFSMVIDCKCVFHLLYQQASILQ
jgi:hypothetical protein